MRWISAAVPVVSVVWRVEFVEFVQSGRRAVNSADSRRVCGRSGGGWWWVCAVRGVCRCHAADALSLRLLVLVVIVFIVACVGVR